MKIRLSTIFILMFLYTGAAAQWVNVPDTNFRKYLVAHYPTAMSGNLLDTTNSSITSAAYMKGASQIVARCIIKVRHCERSEAITLRLL